MSLYHEIREWWTIRRTKTASAKEVYRISTSERAWKRVMRDIQHYAGFGFTMNSVANLNEEFADRLMALGYGVTQNNLVDWSQEPKLEDVERRIEMLIELRDELRKEQLVKELADIEDEDE